MASLVTRQLKTTPFQTIPAESRRAGRTALLRQAYVDATGHCNFQPAGTIAALHAVEHRLDTGHWDDATEPARLDAAATATDLGTFLPYVRYLPSRLTRVRS